MRYRALPLAATLLAELTGFEVPSGMRERLAACLERGAGQRGVTPERYAASLRGDPSALQGLLDCITVQETSFFRDPAQFSALLQHVLPGLSAPVTVWSAGCSGGQEAYSLAIALQEAGCQDWRVLATDVSSHALARARAGRYTEAELSGLAPARRRWLRPCGAVGGEAVWEVDPALRQRVAVGRGNLATGGFPCGASVCQVVFCRNVLIYLGRDRVTAFLDRLAGWLAPGGVLFLGYAESVGPRSRRFQLERLGDTFAYRLRGAAPAPALAAPAALVPAVAPPRPSRHAVPGAHALRAAGERASAAGDHPTAIDAFRKAVYLEPEQPLGHFQLGLALEAAGDRRGARRAYAAALAAIRHHDPGDLEAGIEGYQLGALAGMLSAKLAEPRR
jgi:chemotaxis methyl-accepting protein methylase